MRGIHRWPVNSLHKGPVTRKKFPFDDVIIDFFRYFIRITSPRCDAVEPSNNCTSTKYHTYNVTMKSAKYRSNHEVTRDILWIALKYTMECILSVFQKKIFALHIYITTNILSYIVWQWQVNKRDCELTKDAAELAREAEYGVSLWIF